MTIELDSTLAQAEVLFLSFAQLAADIDRRRAEEMTSTPTELINKGLDGAGKIIEHERMLEHPQHGILRPKTRWNLQKVLKFRSNGAILDMTKKAQLYAVSSITYITELSLKICLGHAAGEANRG